MELIDDTITSADDTYSEEEDESKSSKKTKDSDTENDTEKDDHPTDLKKNDLSRHAMNKAIDKLKERSITQIGLEELLGRKGSLINALTEIDAVKKALNDIQIELKTLSTQVDQQESPKSKDSNLGEESSICQKIEPCLTKIQDQIHQLDAMFNNQVGEMQKQFSNLETELGVLVEKVNAGSDGNEQSGEAEVGGFADVYNKLNKVQNELTQVCALTGTLQEDKEDRESKLEAIMDSIDFLKTIKADKEDIEDALADKADQQTVNRKVSHDQFDAACDDLNRNLEDALLKLNQQEEFWNETLETIQSEVGNKLDKNDIQPLHDFVTGKLKTLHQRLKALATLKKEAEAAGTKTKLLRDVNCLSCDKPAIMRRDAMIPSIPEHGVLPPNRSMKAYLTYELDNIRKQNKKGQIHRNINDIEAARGDMKQAPDDEEKIPSCDNLCNRYCGGSHTITSNANRFTGHVQQIGPEAIPLVEGFAKGTDGKIYKVKHEDSRPPSVRPLNSTEPSQISDKNQREQGIAGEGEGNVKNLGVTTLYKPCICKPTTTSRVVKRMPFKGPPKKS